MNFTHPGPDRLDLCLAAFGFIYSTETEGMDSRTRSSGIDCYDGGDDFAGWSGPPRLQ